MRVSLAFFCAAVLVAVTFILYFMVEFMGISSGGKVKDLSQFTANILDVKEVERKLVVLEATIKHYQEVVADLQAKLESMLIRAPTGTRDAFAVINAHTTAKVTDAAIMHPVKVVRTAAVPVFTSLAAGTADQCPIIDRAPSEVDIQVGVLSMAQCFIGSRCRSVRQYHS